MRDRIRLGPYGVAFGSPRGTVERALFVADAVREELSTLASTYAPFDLAVGATRVRFRGRGTFSAPGPERRRIVEWAQFVAEQSTGFAGPRPAPVLFWQRGNAGEDCAGLGIDRLGEARGGPCAAGGGAPRRLADADLERLYDWFDRLRPFQTSWLEGPAGEQRSLRLVFAGAGKGTASATEREEIGAFASALAAELPVAGSARYAVPQTGRPRSLPLALPLRAPSPPPSPPRSEAPEPPFDASAKTNPSF